MTLAVFSKKTMTQYVFNSSFGHQAVIRALKAKAYRRQQFAMILCKSYTNALYNLIFLQHSKFAFFSKCMNDNQDKNLTGIFLQTKTIHSQVSLQYLPRRPLEKLQYLSCQFWAVINTIPVTTKFTIDLVSPVNEA